VVSYKDVAAARRPYPADGAECQGQTSDAQRAYQLCRQLEVAGVEPQVLIAGHRVRAPGAALAVNARTSFESGVAESQLYEQTFAILAASQGLSIAITGLDSTQAAANALHRLCEILRAAARDACVAANVVEIAIDADAVSPQSAWSTRRELLGDGPVYLIADGERMNPAQGWSTPERCEQFWLQLWHLRDSSAIRAACASVVSSQCPLLSAEAATTVLPGCGVQVSAGSAWLPIHLNLMRFADERGVIDEAALEYALHCSVDSGDALLDLLEWPNATTRHDAWLNRRLAIIVSGLGDLAMQRHLDPGGLRCLDNLSELMRWVQQTLHSRSRQHARQVGHAPALDLGDPGRLLASGDARDDWRMRWRHAIDKGAVRHRNLMVLSPWSVFPSDSPPDMRYANLLPLVAYADACVFARTATLECWNINEFKSFHQRAWAALQQRDSAVLIAERV
jgi:hypothetical protein